ncbi:pyridoxamine 5'-phosphate oxidase family protein [Nocardia rhamnosiphila]
MVEREPVAELLFGATDATPMSLDETTIVPWERAIGCLAAASKAWLATVRPSGHPHVMPVMPVWTDDAGLFTTRPLSTKGRNLARNPHCVLTVSGEELDLVIEGSATRMRDSGVLRQASAAFAARYGWELTVRDGVVLDDGLPGSPEYGFYRLSPVRAFGYGVDGLTATRWRFD